MESKIDDRKIEAVMVRVLSALHLPRVDSINEAHRMVKEVMRENPHTRVIVTNIVMNFC